MPWGINAPLNSSWLEMSSLKPSHRHTQQLQSALSSQKDTPNQNQLLKTSFPEVLQYKTIIAWMKEYSNYGILIMVLFGVVGSLLWFSTAFLLHKATEMCRSYMTKLLNETFKWDDLLNPRRGKNCSKIQRIKACSRVVWTQLNCFS